MMFTPDQEKAAAELARVCRPGGKIGLASWTPSGSIGELFKTIGKYVPPPAGLKSPALWGTEERLRELFADRIGALQCARRHFVFRYRTPQAASDSRALRLRSSASMRRCALGLFARAACA